MSSPDDKRVTPSPVALAKLAEWMRRNGPDSPGAWLRRIMPVGDDDADVYDR